MVWEAAPCGLAYGQARTGKDTDRGNCEFWPARNARQGRGHRPEGEGTARESLTDTGQRPLARLGYQEFGDGSLDLQPA